MRIISANITFLILFLLLVRGAGAQINDSLSRQEYIARRFQSWIKSEIVLGFQWQGNWKEEKGEYSARYFEIGFARSVHSGGMHGPASIGVYASEEIHTGRQNIYGTKLGVYTHYLFDLGLAVIYYTDFKKGNFKLRPEIGLGISAFRIDVGYNVPTVNNKAFERLQKNNAQAGIQFFLPVKKEAPDPQRPIISQLI